MSRDFDRGTEGVIELLEKYPAGTQFMGAAFASGTALVSFCATLLPILQTAAAGAAVVSGILTIAFQIRQWRRRSNVDV